MDEKKFIETLAMMFGKKAEEVTSETTIREGLGATSQMLFGVCALAEQMTGKPTSFAAVNNCKTVQELLDLFK